MGPAIWVGSSLIILGCISSGPQLLLMLTADSFLRILALDITGVTREFETYPVGWGVGPIGSLVKTEENCFYNISAFSLSL